MTTTTIEGHTVHVNDEGFLTDPAEWDEQVAQALATRIGVDLTEDHWAAIRFVREDYATRGETATVRRISTVGGIATKKLFELFPQQPAKKLAYVAGLPKPHGCV
jgi:TusE/DsrC/DsvC family sulfur relay protein